MSDIRTVAKKAATTPVEPCILDNLHSCQYTAWAEAVWPEIERIAEQEGRLPEDVWEEVAEEAAALWEEGAR